MPVLRLVSHQAVSLLSLSPGQAPPAEPSSPGALEPEKGERRLWAMPPMAVALKPVLQQSREVRDDLPGASSVLRSASPDLSLLLGPSFQSQSSFQPLEPKPDLAPPTGNQGQKEASGVLLTLYWCLSTSHELQEAEAHSVKGRGCHRSPWAH